MSNRRPLLFLAVSILVSTGLFAQSATTYFSSVEGLTGTALHDRLHQIISTGTASLSYTPGVWDAHADIYRDPANPDNLILFYSQTSREIALRDRGGSPADYWNREHLWPQSYGTGSNPAYTDLFHLVPAYKGVNSSRGNKYFDVADPQLPGYSASAHVLSPDSKRNTYSWEPSDARKGWAARALLYMDTRYEHLTLIEVTPGVDMTASNSMAQLSRALEWNRRYPPDALELHVQERVFESYQFNRNPFVDFREFADAIHVAGPSWGGWRLRHFSLAELRNPEVSGDMADPDGDQVANLLEMAIYDKPRERTTALRIEPPTAAGAVDITFQRANSMAALNLELRLMVSGDLIEWAEVSLAGAAVEALDTETERVTARYELGVSGTAFFRLVAERIN